MTASEGGSEQEARRLDILLRSRTKEGDRSQHHNNIQKKSSSSSSQAHKTAKIQNNNDIAVEYNKIQTEPEDSSDSQGGRKPSYVGLSCAVSGYSSPYTKYSTELTDIPRKVTPPAQIPVASEPQTLDAVLNNYKPTAIDEGKAIFHSYF